ncbi:class I tRNA ligase family protein [Streptomyces cocklensis]|uniref:Methionyl-tRNA synthetase n=1 Tax=Actinacidiphila cocklensis TaxID=887465 RepID=A0A9W4GP88_9ACTN|nr:class I tRNA ligase family protein [Actinacidiphila cocklensis]MDD1061505.1 class I tRNA ligase family protein [Actinacidiphila cocklensis]WSX77570.1 class I tRNA ligase family protein [Streptomyces sp. NBC_00899]CAG6392220.1 Methionyl-tRNA synthetase [Actinacidiphila cocklensis]
MERTMVIAPGPTANGDLHLGHLAGPFLSADVCARYARAAGRDVLFGTGVHFTQNYIVTTARRLGVPPEELRVRSGEQVERTLKAVGIEPDGFVPFDERYVTGVRRFFERLHAAGGLVLRSVPFPYVARTGEFLTDAYVRGTCPVCLSEGCAGLCEGCGHWIGSGELIAPCSTLDPDDEVEIREARVLVLPLEDHREALTAYFAGLAPTMRPRLARLIEELLAHPLPDYPVTLPISWGIPAPFPEVEGQVIYADAEVVAWSMHSSALAAERRGEAPAGEDALWFAESGAKVVYFFGSDAGFAFGVVGVAMLMALGGYTLPEHFVTNEFYELDNDKFSSSRGHVVTGRELAAEVPRDLIRFYLAATGPDFQRTNFTRGAMSQVTASRLVEPWNRVADKAARAAQESGGGPLPVSARSREAAARMAERFGSAYDARRFSLTAAAFTLTEQLGRLDRWEVTAADAGDFCHEVDVFLRCAAPLLIDLADEALPDLTIPAASPATEVTPRVLPRLTETAQ